MSSLVAAGNGPRSSSRGGLGDDSPVLLVEAKAGKRGTDKGKSPHAKPLRDGTEHGHALSLLLLRAAAARGIGLPVVCKNL